MKKILILLSSTLAITSCTTEEISSSNTLNSSIVSTTETNQLRQTASQTINASTQITITASTRGFSSSIVIKNGKLIKSSTGIVPPTTTTISTAKLNVLNQKFRKLILADFPNYTSTTCLRCGDVGFTENLEITHNGVVYTSQGYDSSNAPIKLKDIVTYIKTLN